MFNEKRTYEPLFNEFKCDQCGKKILSFHVSRLEWGWNNGGDGGARKTFCTYKCKMEYEKSGDKKPKRKYPSRMTVRDKLEICFQDGLRPHEAAQKIGCTENYADAIYTTLRGKD